MVWLTAVWLQLLVPCLVPESTSTVVVGVGVSGPVLVVEPPSQAHLTNSTGETLRCAALGSPPPTLTWQDAGGRTLTSQPGLREVLSDGRLWVSGLDGGRTRATFRCRAANPAGAVISRTATVSKVSTTGVRVRAEGSMTGAGGVGVVRCIVEGVGSEAWVVRAWLRQDTPTATPIPLPDAGRYVYGSDGRLYVQEVEDGEGSARYLCRASHPAAPASATLTSNPAAVTVTSKMIDEAPRVEADGAMVEVEEGQPFTLPCLASGHPPPHYSWSREGGSGGELGSVSGSLGGRVWTRGAVAGGRRASGRDAGGWRCLAANGLGTDTAHYTLSVLHRLQVTPSPPKQVVRAGGRASISCLVEGSPVAEVRWYKDGSPIHPSTSHVHTPTRSRVALQDRDTLVIASVHARDAGMYQCVAANSLGEAQAGSQLSIRAAAPTLQHTFIEQTLQPGPPVSLRCSALGHPPPVITWSLDRRPLTPSPRDPYHGPRVSQDSWVDGAGQVVAQVNISRVSHMDGGRYACTATNSEGSVSHTAALNVYGPPTARSGGNTTAVEGAPAELWCPVAGYPLSKVTWALHNRPLTSMPRRSSRGQGGLSITRVEASQDVGKYTCTATDSQGRTATAEFFLAVVKPPVLAELKFPLNLVEGMRLSVACSLLSGDLPISLSWQRDGLPLPRDPLLTETHSQFFSNLVFADIRGKHAGTYTCTASNAAAASTVSASMNVQVAPWWVVEPVDVAVVGGGEVRLECHAQGTPPPSVTWKRATGAGGEEWGGVGAGVEGGGEAWRRRSPRPGTLLLLDAREEDSGRYQCVADNGVTPSLVKTVMVTVLEGARVEERVVNQSSAVGDSTSLRCGARGHLPITFTWARDGSPITGSEEEGVGVSVESGGRTSVLHLANTRRSHAGVYTCHAANQFGQDSATFFLSVVERPDSPGHVHVREVTSRTVSLAWAPPYDGNSPLTHYLLQHWPARPPAGPPENTTLPRHLTQATLKGLTPGRTYHLQVLAVNPRGASPPSPTLSITTLQEPPTAPPTHLTALPHSSRAAALTLSWQAPAVHLDPGEITGYQIGYKEASGGGGGGGGLERTTAEIGGAIGRRVGGEAEEDYNDGVSGGGDGDGWRWRSVRGGQQLSGEVMDLKHYTSYTVTVRAVNRVGPGPIATPVSVTTSQGVPSGAPGEVRCDPLSSQALRVRWAPLPRHLANGPVHGYKVSYKRASNIQGSNAVEIKRTTNLETNLQNLGRYTNYTIRVLAYTGAGDGVLSPPVHCSTLQDVPDAPPAIKALPSGVDSVVVSWLPPKQPNGALVQYTLYHRPLNAHQATRNEVVGVGGSGGAGGGGWWVEVSRTVGGLASHARYEFWVSASTRVGEGAVSRVVSQRPAQDKQVAARIKSFGQVVEVAGGSTVSLPCTIVGHPSPTVTWSLLGRPPPSAHAQTLPDHSLHLANIKATSSGNYTCTAVNPVGRDEVVWMVEVVQPPAPPTLRVQFATQGAIHLAWSPQGDGGKPITGYIIRYRLEGSGVGEWAESWVEPDRSTHTLDHLRCGSTYHLQMAATNQVGRGVTSRTVNTRTRGSAPRQPRHQDLVSVNSSSITLHLFTWPSGGCPITGWTVDYRPRSSPSFSPASPHPLAPDTDTLTLPDLAPLTWHQVKVTAHNAAGSTTAIYDVATASLTGATLAPASVVDVSGSVAGGGMRGLLDPHVLAPVVSGVACTLALLLCVGLLLSRGRAHFLRIGRISQRGKGGGGVRNGGSSSSSSGGGGSGGGVYSRSLAEMQNHHNDSQEQLSPAAREKHEEAYTEIACISSQQTLPISSLAGGRGVRGLRRKTTQDEEVNGGEVEGVGGSDSEQDTSGSPGDTLTHHPTRDTYKVPVRLRRGADFSYHPPDSSTESNDERSPLPPRRPPHQHPPQSNTTNNTSTTTQHHNHNHHHHHPHPQPTTTTTTTTTSTTQHAAHHHPSRQHAFTPAHPRVIRSSSTLESVYSVEGSLGGALRPPTGFSDSRELSEAECDRDAAARTKARQQHPSSNQSGCRRSFPPGVSQDYSIHV